MEVGKNQSQQSTQYVSRRILRYEIHWAQLQASVRKSGNFNCFPVFHTLNAGYFRSRIATSPSAEDYPFGKFRLKPLVRCARSRNIRFLMRTTHIHIHDNHDTPCTYLIYFALVQPPQNSPNVIPSPKSRHFVRFPQMRLSRCSCLGFPDTWWRQLIDMMFPKIKSLSISGYKHGKYQWSTLRIELPNFTVESCHWYVKIRLWLASTWWLRICMGIPALHTDNLAWACIPCSITYVRR